MNSQDPVPVEKSDSKVIIEGNVYYLHIVKAGQTLYSISKAYNLKEFEIEKENPGVTSGLKIGQVLKIPMTTIAEMPETHKQDSTDYIRHIFQKGETLFSLSRQYKTNLEDVLKMNPDIDPSSIKEGQIIYFPKSVTEKTVEDFFFHKVRRKETLYSISRQYEISVDDIKKHNPELLTGTLKTGSVLTIPRYRITTQTLPIQIIREEPITEIEDKHEPEEIITVITDTTESDMLSVYENIPERRTNKTINAALLLPFNFIDIPDTMQIDNIKLSETKTKSSGSTGDVSYKRPGSTNYLDFLSGSLLALDSLKSLGISVNLKVFDTQREPSRVRSIIESGKLNDADIIIGPVLLSNAEIISEFSVRKKTPLVIPFLSSENLINNNPYLFQLSTSTPGELNCIAEYIAQYNDYCITIIYTNDNNEPELANYLKSKLEQRFAEKMTGIIPEIKEIIYDPAIKMDLSAELLSTLSQDKKNMVIIPSTNEAFVYVAVTQLFFQLKNYQIELFGMPQWSVFQNVDLQYLHALNLRFLTSYYFNYNDPDIKNYLGKFRKEFGTEPVSLTRKGCNYAFLGYDILWHFMNAFHEYGNKYFKHAGQINYDLLMNSFRFKKYSAHSGFENTSLKVIHYTPELNITYENFSFNYTSGYEKVNIIETEEVEIHN